MNGGDRPTRRRTSSTNEESTAALGHPLPRGPAELSPSFVSLAADEIALNALQLTRSALSSAVCDVCDRQIEGEPAGSGLYFWTRDGEARWEEPALCARCAPAIGLSALKRWAGEADGGE